MATEPALTAEEWARMPDVAGSTPRTDLPLYFPSRHGIAAVNLSGQPFGFTREDVTYLRSVGEVLRGKVFGPVSGLHVDDIADRIEALLPPEPS